MNNGHIIGIDITTWDQPRIMLYDHVFNLRHSSALFDVDELLLLDYLNFKIQSYQERISNAIDNLIALRHILNLVTTKDHTNTNTPPTSFNLP
jgi:hypothetical protein